MPITSSTDLTAQVRALAAGTSTSLTYSVTARRTRST